MARYEINYLDGSTDQVEAEGVEFDIDARDYTFYTDKQAVALAPAANVRSIIKRDEALTRETPSGPQPAKTTSRNSGEVNG